MSQLKVVIGLPLSGRFVPPEFSIALASLQFPMNCNYAFFSAKGLDRAKNRTNLVKSALQYNAEYIFFLDDDTVPPANAVRLLMKELEQNEKAAVCAGIYTSRNTKPYEPMVFMDGRGGPWWRWRFGDVFKCASIGTGCMLIRTSLFKDLPEPWFWDIQDKQEALEKDPSIIATGDSSIDPNRFTMTDDVYFCHKVRKAGFDILAHGGVLAIHYNQDGSPAVMDMNDFPLRNIDGRAIWYNSLIPSNYYETRYQEVIDDLPSGWLSKGEAARLAKEVTGCRVLELGSYKGRSTVVMAETADQVICVDTFEGTGEAGGVDTLGAFLTNTAPYPHVIPIVGLTGHIQDLFADKVFDVVFVDAEHTFESAKADFELAKQFGKRILAHDWNGFDVNAAADAAGLAPLWVEETLVELVPKEN